MNACLSEQDIRLITRCYLTDGTPVAHQIESYDYLVQVLLPRILNESNSIIVRANYATNGRTLVHVFKCSNYHYSKPSYTSSDGNIQRLTPELARKYALTYCSKILCTVTHTTHTLRGDASKPVESDDDFEESEPVQASTLHWTCSMEDLSEPLSTSVHHDQTLFELPVMVRSVLCSTREDPDPHVTHECLYDYGGYFLINGNEKVMLMQTKPRNNIPLCTIVQNDIKFEIRSLGQKVRSTSTLYVYLSKNSSTGQPEIKFELPFMKQNAYLAWIFRLLGVTDIAEMREYISGSRSPNPEDHEYSYALECVLSDPMADEGIVEICRLIGKQSGKTMTPDQRERATRNVMNNEFLPHIGNGERTPEVLVARACYVGEIVNRMLLIHLGRLDIDDRDNFQNKRVETPGMLLGLLIRQHYRLHTRRLSNLCRKAVWSRRQISIPGVFSTHGAMSRALVSALATGNWGQGKVTPQMSISQVLSRTSPQATVSHCRRVNTPANRQSKMTEPRQLHTSHRGILCPNETPEGSGCGLITNLAIGARVRIGYDPSMLSTVVHSTGMINRVSANFSREHSVTINGARVGSTTTPEVLTERLREMRATFEIPYDVTIAFCKASREVMLCCDSGALLRPLFVVKNLCKVRDIVDRYKHAPDMNLWPALMLENVVEFVDKKEESTLVTCEVSDCLERFPEGATHVEIEPNLMFGFCASAIPFPDHNQAPRNMYQAGMSKQAIGMPCLNAARRYDNTTLVATHTHRPLACTDLADITHQNDTPGGQQIYVALVSYMSGNAEDNIVFKRQAVDRGFGEFVHTTCVKETEQTKGADVETIETPDLSQVRGVHDANHGTLGPDGIAIQGTVLKHRDAIIGKVMRAEPLVKTDKSEVCLRDRTVVYNKDYPSVVDRVAVFPNPSKDNLKTVKIHVTAYHRPEVGDKFSSRHGQKGTAGLIVNECDMPYDAVSGIIPDALLNICSIPSRMTVGHLLEGLVGGLAAHYGISVDASAFRHQTSIDNIQEALRELGFDPVGNCQLVDGITGQMHDQRSFMFMIHYQTLEHIVSEKMHARGRHGPVQLMTRQPVEGRKKDGGLRVGNMEMDCLVSYGSSAVLIDRLRDESDAFQIAVCSHCGSLAENLHPDLVGRHDKYSYQAGLKHRGFNCRTCETGEHVRVCKIPYATLLLLREIQAAGIGTKLLVE